MKKSCIFLKRRKTKKAGLTSFHKNENSADIGSRNRQVKGIFHMMKLNTKVTRSISSRIIILSYILVWQTVVNLWPA